MATVQRLPLSTWPTYALTWTTEFNDLRLALPEGTSSLQAAEIELKTHALFNEHTVIRDTDLICSPTLMQILADDYRCAREAVAHRAILLSLREEAESFAHVNDIMGVRRAFPEHHRVGLSFLPQIDRFINERSVALPSTRVAAAPTAFQDNLRKLVSRDYLLSHDRDKLLGAIEGASCRESGPLRLGVILDFLWRKGERPGSDLVQWCRAAHSLIVPAQLGLPVSTADSDLDPVKAALFHPGNAPRPVERSVQPDLFPRRVLAATALRQLSFDQIVKHRQTGRSLGYFDAMAKVRTAASRNRERLDACYKDYLLVLAEYITALGMEHNVELELVDWQAALIDKLDWQEKLRFMVYPIAFAIGGGLLTMGLLDIGIVTAGVGVGYYLNKEHLRSDAARKRVLGGHTTTVPPEPEGS